MQTRGTAFQPIPGAPCASVQSLYMPFSKLLPKKVDPVLVQRLILAFTTGLFLACAANVSAGPNF
jgi:hypothetical protein